ncbi:MAG: ATP-binding protein [Lachnospiraceae bacterium]|nr:ATP-binding protein [Lachnospiraceae bacterium]
MKELNVIANIDNIDEVMEFVTEELEKLECSLKVQTQIETAVEELFVNIATYAYKPDEGPATVRVEVEKEPPAISITFIDQGVPYDPLAKTDPDVTLSAEDREIGGLGIFMVKESMDNIDYEYKDGKNILHIRKLI